MEKDLRSVVLNELLPSYDLNTVITSDELEKISDRYKKAEDTDLIIDDDHTDLIHYLDFYDTVQVINRNRERIPSALAQYFRNISPTLEKCTPIRNAVMHGRPLEIDNFSTMCAIADDLAKHTEYKWQNISDTLAEINNDSGYVFGLNFTISEDSSSGVFHNLPIPDFDDTGFVGRKGTLTKIADAISGPFPVISLIGPGGVGKTALALKCAFEMLEKEDSIYDAIVWVSAKASTLTAKEITRIEDAIEDSLGIFTSIVDEFESSHAEESEDRLLELLTVFKVLLILDNLETVLDETLRDFIQRTPRGSKILITSRIGLSAGDLAIQIDPLSLQESRIYYHKLVQAYSVPFLQNKPADTIDFYINRLFCNPLFLKWFVTAVKSGSIPEKLLSNQTDILKFCLENVVDHLDKTSKIICGVYLVVDGPHSLPMLARLTELSPDDIEESISKLINFNIISMASSKDTDNTSYQMGELPRAYLKNIHIISSSTASNIGQRYRNVQHTIEEVRHYQGEELYRYGNFLIENKDQAVVASQLKIAFAAIRKKNYDVADELLSKLSVLAPGYFEVERVKAILKFGQRDYVGALRSYTLARELKPNYAPLSFWYGGFLLRAYNDLEGALAAFEEAQRLLPSVEVERERARVMLYMGKFGEAAAILDNLLRRDDEIDRNRSKIIDLRIQCFHRNADHQIVVGEYQKAVDLIEAARDHSEKIPIKLYDAKMADKYRKFQSLIDKLIDKFEGSPTEPLLLSLKVWASDFAARSIPTGRIGRNYMKTTLPQVAERPSVRAGRTRQFEGKKGKGNIARISATRKFGFIRTEEGDDLFFHESSVSSASQCSFMGIGVSVYYSVGTNSKGFCAADVSLIFDHEIDDLVNSEKTVRAYVLNLRDGTDYGFSIIPDYGEVMIRKTDFIDVSEWHHLREGDSVEYFVNRGDKGYTGTRIRLVK